MALWRPAPNKLTTSSSTLQIAMARFSGKVVIVTGSSSGIGRATAILFAKESAKVVITGRNAANLKETHTNIVNAGVSAANIHCALGDITLKDFQKKLVDETIAKFGKLDVLVNNAGAAIAGADSQQSLNTDTSILLKNLQLNLISVIDLVQVARPHLVASKGEIVNVSTIGALKFGFANFPYYSIAKAGLDQATRAMAVDLIKEGVRVNTVNPGVVVTNFISAVGIPDEVTGKIYDYYASKPECIPRGQAGSALEIAEAIAFLADRKTSSYIIGQNIIADGGSSIIMGMAAHDIGKVLASQ